MRNKFDLDTLSMDDLYNNLKVYESEIKSQSSPSLNSHNVAFVYSNNSSSTNEIVNTAHNVFATSSEDQASTASYADDVIFSFFSNQSNAPQLDNEDLEQIDIDDLEEMDLKWQVAMLTMRVKRFIKKIARKLDLNGKEIVRFDKTKVKCYNYHRRGKGHCVLVPAFWFLRFVSCDLVSCVLTDCVLVLRFSLAFCLVEDFYYVLLKRDSAQLETPLRFVSKASCVLLQDSLRFASSQVAFCFKTSCVLSQDSCVLS
nr:hypothetical protein [Tanacetum cinerariifolium]